MQDTLLLPASPGVALAAYPWDVYVGQAAVDMSFVSPDGHDVEVFNNVHIPWGVALAAPPTSLAVSMSVVLERDVPIPFLTVRVRVARTPLTKAMTVVVCALMWALALIVFAMGVDYALVAPRAPNLSVITMAFALLFALPPLRGVQAGVPPPIIAADMWSFFWCMLLIAAGAALSAVALFAYEDREPWVDDGDGGDGRGDGDGDAPERRKQAV